jgi:hypothetical protein
MALDKHFLPYMHLDHHILLLLLLYCRWSRLRLMPWAAVYRILSTIERVSAAC